MNPGLQKPLNLISIPTKAQSILYLALSLMIVFFGCENEVNVLTVTPVEVNFGKDGGSQNIDIHTDAQSWSLNNPASDWLELSSTSGNQSSATVKLTVTTRTLSPRSADLILTAGNANPVTIKVSQAVSDHLFIITADVTNLGFRQSGETKSVKITTDGSMWNLSADVDWLQFDQTSGDNGTTTVKVTASSNGTDGSRVANISITGENAATVQIQVTQQGPLYPSYNTSPIEADLTGMSSSAVQLAANIRLGWNLGNTLEAIGGETAWGNPKASKALIDLVKQNGFNAVRIPCSWNQYMANATTAELKKEWLDRVKEVIQYCVDNDMYALLNIHWDGGWLENNVTADKQVANNAKQKAFWEQIATHMRDFDEHLLFCSTNEPNVENAEQMSVLNSYHQTFVNAVRSTGGRNAYRVLVVQGPSTDIEKTDDLMTALPTDVVSDRMMAEIHFYTPYQFCLMTEDATWGKMFYYWGNGFHSETDASRNATWGEEEAVDNLFASMKTKFVDNGIPVVLGEYAAIRRTSLTGDALTRHLASRAHYLTYVTRQALANGLLPFYWDAGGLGDLGSGLFDRQTNTVFDEQALNAILEGAAE